MQFSRKTNVLRLYVDSADTQAIAPLLASSLVYGVTTNPTVLDRAGRTASDIPSLYQSWAAAGAREIFFQSWGGSENLLEQRARDILALGDLAVVKIPATRAGFAVSARLAREGAPVLLTAVTTPAQASVGVSLGVRYLAAYLGRTRDAGIDALTEIARMQAICDGTDTNVLAASVRSADDVVALVEAGVPYVTAAPEILWQMLDHEATTAAAAAFEAADSVQTQV